MTAPTVPQEQGLANITLPTNRAVREKLLHSMTSRRSGSLRSWREAVKLLEPVVDHHKLCRSVLLLRRIRVLQHEEAPVGRDVVAGASDGVFFRVDTRVGATEEFFGQARRKRGPGLVGLDGDAHHGVTAAVEQCASIRRPAGLESAVRRDPPRAILHGWEGPHVNLLPSREL